MNKYLYPSLSLLAVVFILFSCTRTKEISVSANQVQYIPSVELVECVNRDYIRTFSTYGSIIYTTKADVYPMSTEIIRSLLYEEGDIVQKGQVLAKMDRQKLEIQLKETRAGVQIKETQLNLSVQQWEDGRRNIEAQFFSIANARLDLKKAEADFNRIATIYENKKQLYEVEGITKEELDSVELEYFEKDLGVQQTQSNLEVKMIGYRDEDLSKAGYVIPEDQDKKKLLFIEYNTRMLKAEVEVTRAELDAALSQEETLKLYLKETIITAPISGIIGMKYMEEGEKASQDKPLYLIFPDKLVYALAEVSEKDLTSIGIGQAVDVTTDTSGQVRQGKIERISPWIQKETRTATVKIILKNEDSFFRVGQFVRIIVRLSEATRILMIPQNAVLYEKEQPYVFTYRGGHLFRADLDCGMEEKGFIPVRTGLSQGDRVVLNPRESFRDGLEVKLR